ncbi:MAG: carboxymuconolactone decarboxylase family protein [Hyphomicrobiaceae bacterium]
MAADDTAGKSELYKKGLAVRRSLRSEAEFEQNQKDYAADPHTKKFIDLATETVFGALWARPTLDHKLRALICVVTDATMGRHDELAIHLRFALKQGWTEDELVEVLLHMSGYIGVPLVREAIYCAKDVFADVRAKAQQAT